ncbi:unnamed protein product, partial [Rotaria sp. Silwood1]
MPSVYDKMTQLVTKTPTSQATHYLRAMC